MTSFENGGEPTHSEKPAYPAHMGFEWLGLLLPLLGHVLYGLPPDPEASGELLVSLHNGDDFSTADEAPHPERLRNLRAVTGSGDIGLQARGSKESGVAIDTTGVLERPCWVAVETPPVFTEIEADHFHRYLQHEGLQQVIAHRLATGQQAQPGREIYSKHVEIALNDADAKLSFLDGNIGLPIEIVPTRPGPVGVGDQLSIRVLVNGKPAADLQVRASHRASENSAPSEDFVTRTDQDGITSINIRQRGLWRLHTIAMTTSADPQTADWISSGQASRSVFRLAGRAVSR